MSDVGSQHDFQSSTEKNTSVDMSVNSLTPVEISATYSFPVFFPRKRKLGPDHPFFVHGNVERELLAKQVAWGITADEIMDLFPSEMQQPFLFCPVAGCHVKLNTVADFDSHYMARHMATCSVCHRQYPSNRLLNIHIAENHDSFFKAKVDRGYDMYECLVENCSSKFQSDGARHRHLVDLHKFPKSFQFSKKKHSSKKHRKKLSSKQPLVTPSPTSVVKGETGKPQGKNKKAGKGRKKNSGRGERAVPKAEEDEKSLLSKGSVIDSAGSKSDDITLTVTNQQLSQFPKTSETSDMEPVRATRDMETDELSRQQSQAPDQRETETKMDIDMENVTSRLSKLSMTNPTNLMVPTAVSFGRRRALGAIHNGRPNSSRKVKGRGAVGSGHAEATMTPEAL